MSTYRQKIAAAPLPEHWFKHDEATGSFVDAGTLGATGTASEANITRGINAAEWGPGVDSCIRLASGGYVSWGDICNFPSNQAYTIFLSFKPASRTNDGMLVGRRNTVNSRGWMIDLNARSVRSFFATQSGNYSVTADTVVQAQNCWVHAVIRNDGSGKPANAAIWVGGVKQTSLTTSGTAGGAADTTGYVTLVGIYNDLNLLPFVGDINDVIIYKSALTDEQIAARLPSTPMDTLIAGPHDTHGTIQCPFVTRGSDGKLYAIHWGGTGHYNSAGASIYLQTSTNGGITWTTPTAIVTLAATGHTSVPSAFGIFTFDGVETLVLAYRDYKYDDASEHTVYTIRSTDGGTTWEGVTAPLTDNSASKLVSTLFEVNCNFILNGSTLILCGDALGAGAGTIKYYQSTDGATTWGNPVTVIQGTGYAEPNLLILPSGTWLMLLRVDGVGNKPVKMITSPTGAAGSWSAASDAFTNTPSAPKMCLLPNGRIYVSYRQATTANCAYRYSDDSGATWADGTEVMYRAATQAECCWWYDATNDVACLAWSVGEQIVGETIYGDTTAPTATLLTEAMPEMTGGGERFFSLRFADAGSGVDGSTITNNVIVVRGPDSVYACTLNEDPLSDAASIDAEFYFTIDEGDATTGTFTVETVADDYTITDVAGNAMEQGLVIGTWEVAEATPAGGTVIVISQPQSIIQSPVLAGD